MRIIGIYYLRSIKKNFYYIGKSVNVARRKVRHFSELRNNKHSNQKLQRHFSKYGEKDFEYGILEQIQDCKDLEQVKKTLINLEINYISKFDSFYDGFNLTKGGDGLGGAGRKFSLRNIETNEIKNFNSLSEAAILLDCSSQSSIHAVLSGKCNTCKGWCRVFDEKRETGTGTRSKEFVLFHPLYGEYHGSNQSAFRRKYNINCDVSSLIKGKRNSCCGWTCIQG